MTQYTWADNPTAAKVAVCDPNVLNSCLMHLKYDVPETFDTELLSYSKKDLSNVSPVQAFKTSSISWGMPDYSAGVDYANNTTVKTAPSNGVLVISYYVNAQTTGYFKINGKNIATNFHTSVYGTMVTGQYMLSKGNTFQITSVGSATTSIPFICRFYPCKGSN